MCIAILNKWEHDLKRKTLDFYLIRRVLIFVNLLKFCCFTFNEN